MPGSRGHILALDPFLEGSHLDVLEGWKKHTRHQVNIIGHRTGPWHWRMRHGAISLSREIRSHLARGKKYDVIFTTSMLHLGELKSLLPELTSIPSVVYFHENQLTYPHAKKPDPHLIFNQFIGSLCAEEIWFNSNFHLQQYHDALKGWLNRMPPPSLLPEFQTWKEKSKVVYPGVDLFEDFAQPIPAGGPLQLLWSARWEDDKNPQVFIEYVESLVLAQVELEVTLMGCQPSREDPLIKKLINLLGSKLHLPGFLESRASMIELQKKFHLHVSTTRHEFFGLSVMESAISGRAVCLPRQLSYPELYEALEREDEGILLFHDIREAIAKTISFNAKRKQGILKIPSRGSSLSEFSWTLAANRFDDPISLLMEKNQNGSSFH